MNEAIIRAILNNSYAMSDRSEEQAKALAPLFKFNATDPSIMILDPNRWFTTIEFTDKLAAFLNRKFVKDEIANFHFVDSQIHIDETLFVYCDIIQDQYVGDTMAPLLRTVRTSSDKSNVSIMYENPHYVPLKTTRLSTINISIMDHFGKQILFSDNLKRTIVKLHFKPHGL